MKQLKDISLKVFSFSLNIEVERLLPLYIEQKDWVRFPQYEKHNPILYYNLPKEIEESLKEYFISHPMSEIFDIRRLHRDGWAVYTIYIRE